MDDASPILIDFDLPCMRCQYNLRGLPPEGARCPECGTDVVETINNELTRPNEAVVDLLDRRRRQPFVPIATAANASVDAVMFVRDALGAGIAMLKPKGWFGRQKPLNAEEICTAVAWLTASYFNNQEEARELLHEWGVRGSEDVGRIVQALIDAGWAAPQSFKPEDFEGLFTLDSLLQAAPKRQ